MANKQLASRADGAGPLGGAAKPPRFLFSATALEKGSGGIAELSRQVLSALLKMERDGLLRLSVQVLEGSGPDPQDELFQGDTLPPIRWHDGNRWKFALHQIVARPDLRLFDHLGIARLSGLHSVPPHGPYAVLIHGVEIWNGSRPDYVRTARNASLLIANSEYTAGRVRARHPDLPEIRVCWPGRGPMEPPSPHDEILDRLGPHAMLIVGRLCAEQRHKGHDQLLEAMPLILERVSDAQLVIAGGGDDRDRLEAKAHGLGIGESVVFTGWVDEERLSALYSHCALFVMPSEGDGFGIVFLEAMMHGLPCVGSGSGSAAELLEDGKSGLLIDGGDRSGTAERLSRLLADRARRHRLGESGRTRYETKFREQQHSARFRSIIQRHLSAPVSDSGAERVLSS